MKKIKYFAFSGFFVALIIALPQNTNAQAMPVITTTSVTVTVDADEESLLALIETLTKQLEDLKKQLAQKQYRESFLADGLQKGMTDNNDVVKIQKLLANDPTVYPEGFITGYYGEMTKKAIMNFQIRHQLSATGEIDFVTKELLQEYLRKDPKSRFPY